MNFRNLTPIVRALILANAAVFVLSFLMMPQLLDYLAVYYPQSQSFRIWQILTHMFTHGGWMHLLFNMLTLLSFGPVLEKVLGAQRFASLYFISGLGAYAVYSLWMYFQVQGLVAEVQASGLNPAEIFANSDRFNLNREFISTLNPPAIKLLKSLITQMVGASGAIFGVLTAFALLFPNAELFVMFIPIPIKAKYLLPVVLVGSIYLGINQMEGGNVAHFAHLGGALTGFLWIKWWQKNNPLAR